MGLWPFGKKEDSKKKSKSTDDGDDISIESSSTQEQQSASFGGNIDIELTKIKGQLEGLNEVRKAQSERFQHISEEIGELRGMMTETNKSVGTVEISATKAIDLVNAVQPDKLMIDVRKIDGKVEALRAMIEANEAMMKDMMQEMKSMRSQMNFYKGTEQVVKMTDDIKKEVAEIKQQEALVERHANKVETIFLEVEKKFSEFDKFNDITKDLDKSFKKISADFDKVKVQVDERADKKEFVKVVGQFNEFEKHTGNILKLLESKSKSIEEDLNERFDILTKSLKESFEKVKAEITKKQNVDLSKVKLDTDSAAAAASSEKKEEKPRFNITGLFKKDEGKGGKDDGKLDIQKELAQSSLGSHDDKPVAQATPPSTPAQ